MTVSRSLPVALPSLYFVLLVVTLSTGEKTASGGNPLFCLSLPWSLPLVASSETTIAVVVGLFATVWWWFMDHIGYSGYSGKLGRAGAVLGAALILSMCVIEAALMGSEFRLISKEPSFGGIDGAIYTLAVVLLLGGLVSATHAGLGAFRRR